MEEAFKKMLQAALTGNLKIRIDTEYVGRNVITVYLDLFEETISSDFIYMGK